MQFADSGVESRIWIISIRFLSKSG